MNNAHFVGLDQCITSLKDVRNCIANGQHAACFQHVTEILEDAVAPPAPFTPFALDAALEADLAHPVLTPALRAAFRPPLATGARVDVLEAAEGAAQAPRPLSLRARRRR